MNNLDKLKLLLLGPEQKRLERLDGRVQNLEESESRLTDELPRAIKALENDNAFLASLEKPVTKTLHKSIRRDTQTFAELLFPVIGPAVRRAVADAMRSLVQRINLTMDQRLSVKAVRWRMEAARSGVPIAQLILRDTMLYSVQEVFLIHPASGLVIQRAARNSTLALDQDAVSSMLTAIQSFIRDSLGADSHELLRSAELATNTLWVINGPGAVLACVISGQPPRELRNELIENLEGMHIRHGERFEALAGRHRIDRGLRTELEDCLIEQQHEQAQRSLWPTLIKLGAGLFLILSLAGWLIWYQMQRAERLDRLTDRFSATEGIIVADSQWESGKMQIEGLRDPMAPSVTAIIAAMGESSDDIEAQFKPYYSLEPGVIIRRLEHQLNLPERIGLSIEGQTLLVAGPVTDAQISRIRSQIAVHPVITEARFVSLAAPDAVQENPGEALQLVPGRAVELKSDPLESDLPDSEEGQQEANPTTEPESS